ncbi:MAG: tetratricopeptide repeat protein [Nannocystaceae bacterium]|nr:tetratricopeptide repeat protein [bacterium]
MAEVDEMNRCDELDILQRKVSACLDVDRHAEARELLRRAFEIDPDDPGTLALAIRFERRVENTERALEVGRRALAVAPHDYETRFLFALTLKDAGRYPEAERLLLQLIRDFPDDPDLIAYYGLLMFYALHVEKAEALGREALRLDAENTIGQLVANLSALSRGDANAASAALARALDDDPDSEVLLNQIGLVLVEQGRYAEALDVFQRLLRTSPNDEDYVDLVIRLRAMSHPLTWISRTAQRVGMVGMFAVYVACIVSIHQLNEHGYTRAAMWTAIAWILIVVWSWTGIQVMQRWVRARGVR